MADSYLVFTLERAAFRAIRRRLIYAYLFCCRVSYKKTLDTSSKILWLAFSRQVNLVHEEHKKEQRIEKPKEEGKLENWKVAPIRACCYFLCAMLELREACSTLLFLCTALACGVCSEFQASNPPSDSSQGLSIWLEEDEPESKITKTGLQMTEGTYGIPVSIDSLFEQIQPNPPDDQECTNGSELSEMDMCLTQPQLGLFSSISPPTPGKRKKRQASANGFSLWENGVIPYVFNSTFPAQDRDAIVNAMSEWEKGSCVRFRPANLEDRDMIVFRDGKRCSTNIGRITGEQAVTLAKTCRSKRILIHELGHVIGLIHEHQRHDRDKYVKVMLEHVRNTSQERYQFTKLLSGSITDKNVKYDYTSVMHYGKNYFARAPHLITLHTRDQRYQDVIGRAEKPSFSDLETVNRLYLCSAGCPRSLHCGDHCYMDRMCMCRCRAGYDKAYFSGPGPYRNNLADSTCEFFASRGECTGNIKDTVRPLCAKSCGLHQYKFNTPTSDTVANGNRNGNLVQRRQQLLRQQLQLQQNSKRGRLGAGGGGGGGGSGGSLISPASPSASRVWSRGNSINAIGSGIGLNKNNNFANSVYSNNLNSVNEIQYLRGGGGGGRARQQQQQRNFQNQAILRDDGQMLPGSEVRGQQARMAQQQHQNFRAAFLQRQAALSSSEPNLLRSLVLGRSPDGRTARLLLPAQVNSRSLQRRLSSGPSPISPQRLSLLRQQQDATRLPLLARPGAANLLSPAQNSLARSRLTRTSAFRARANWVAPEVNPQQRELELNRQRLLDSVTANERQRGVSNAMLNARNLALLSPTAASSAAMTTSRWRNIPSGDGRFLQGRNSAGEFSVSGANQWRKPVGAASFRGQNMPVTLDLERVSGPLPLAGFNDPKFGAGHVDGVAGKTASTDAGGSTDIHATQGGPGESGRVLDASSQGIIITDNTPTVSGSGNKELWDGQPSSAGNFPPPPQDIVAQPLAGTGESDHRSYDNLPVNNNNGQGFEPPPPPVPPIPPLSNSDPTLWDSFMSGAGSQPETVGSPMAAAYHGGTDIGNQKSNTNHNNEPFIDVLSLAEQPHPIPIDPHPQRLTNFHDVKGNIDSASGGNNGPQYNLWGQLQQDPHQQPQINHFQRQQQQRPHESQTLLQRINQFQAFTDSDASVAATVLAEPSNEAIPNKELRFNSSIISPGTSPGPPKNPPSPDVTNTGAFFQMLAKTEPDPGDLLQTQRWLRYPTYSQRSTPASTSPANQHLGLTSGSRASANKGGNSSDMNHNRSENTNSGSGYGSNSQTLFRSLFNSGIRFSKDREERVLVPSLYTLPSVRR
ncbi:hypothetical protein RRG08_012588 [Elysia crispata]|uniref:Metalloendopeptidase n=1 Tax=Elysia crispata TaxID=231223 RepID=A0AAE1AKH2_9GAST|nr:hypothetical protein RRG08_012588 [Elysia crispata]